MEFSASHNALPVRRLWVCKKIRGGTARTPDQSWPKGYSISYDCILNNKTGGNWLGWTEAASQCLDGPRSVGTEQLHCALLLYSFIIIVHSFSVVLHCLYLNTQVLSFFWFSTPSHWRGVNKQLCGLQLPAGLNHNMLIKMKLLCTIYLDLEILES